jgi:hypothetical protein
LTGQQSKQTKKLENSTLSMFLEVNEKTRKLSSKHVSGGERARRSGIFFVNIKFSADSGILLALAWNFLQFPDFFWLASNKN